MRFLCFLRFLCGSIVVDARKRFGARRRALNTALNRRERRGRRGRLAIRAHHFLIDSRSNAGKLYKVDLDLRVSRAPIGVYNLVLTIP